MGSQAISGLLCGRALRAFTKNNTSEFWRKDPFRATALSAQVAAAGDAAVKTIATFEDRNPFSGAVTVAVRASQGRKALRIDSSGRFTVSRPKNR